MENRIRISCAVLCRIAHEGRYLLLINENRRRRGVYILSPIGGALTVDDARPVLEMGAEFEDANSRDLRLTLPHAALDDFRVWFYRGEGRELTPFRELHEELVLESSLLPSLTARDVSWQRLWTVEQEGFTGRLGQTGVLTHYFFEIYNVTFTTPGTLGLLLDLPPESGALWTTHDLIDNCGTVEMDVDGASRSVRINGQAVLHPPTDARVAPGY
ncbi:hypothetical protein [Aggregatilinea lenta]|uniref:SMODS-associated NUDIX domain-containing protein n=1 Tax=Aggregatilinea lenta TaxID=913108 RepID=UPI0013C36B9F|nr:hypothetical protein [Aggregatilinea lenta]